MINKQEVFNITDYTNLDENLSVDQIEDFYENYNLFSDNNLKPASLCLYPEALKKLIDINAKIDSPCVVINFPYADHNFQKIEEDIKLACENNAELDLVFPTAEFLKNGNESKKVHDILSFYQNLLNKYNNKANVKIILETSYFYNEDNEFLALKLINAIDLAYDYLYSNDYILFLKTSTGKVFESENHTHAVSVMGSYISNKDFLAKNLGIKISGNVKEMKDVQHYLFCLPDNLDLLKDGKFRIGASKLLANLTRTKDADER